MILKMVFKRGQNTLTLETETDNPESMGTFINVRQKALDNGYTFERGELNETKKQTETNKADGSG